PARPPADRRREGSPPPERAADRAEARPRVAVPQAHRSHGTRRPRVPVVPRPGGTADPARDGAGRPPPRWSSARAAPPTGGRRAAPGEDPEPKRGRASGATRLPTSFQSERRQAALAGGPRRLPPGTPSRRTERQRAAAPSVRQPGGRPADSS